MYKSSKINRAKFKLKVPKIISPNKKDKTLSPDQLKENFQLAGKAAKDRKLTRKLIADSMGRDGYLSVHLVKDCNLCNSNFNVPNDLNQLEKPPYPKAKETLQKISNTAQDQNLKKSVGYMLNLFEVKEVAKETDDTKINKNKLFSGSGFTRTANTLVKKHNWAMIDIVKSAQFLIKNLNFNIMYKGILTDENDFDTIKNVATNVISNPSATTLEALISQLKESFKSGTNNADHSLKNSIGKACKFIAGDKCLGAAEEKIKTAAKNLEESYEAMQNFKNKYGNIKSAEEAFFDGETLKLNILDDLINIFADDYDGTSEPTKLKYKGLGKEAKNELLKFIKSMHTKKTSGIKNVEFRSKQDILHIINAIGKVTFPKLPLKNAINIYGELQKNINDNIQPVLSVIFPGT